MRMFVAVCLFTTVKVAAFADSQSPALQKNELHIGVYSDVGAGRSLNDLLRAIRRMDDTYIHQLTAEDIRSGALAELDLLVHPGGSGSKQARQLGEEGRERVRQFVNSGGGYIGICAGAYLASADYSWSLNLLDAKVLDRKHWARGMGTVDIRLTDTGSHLFENKTPRLQIFYGQGPLLAPADNPDIPDYEPLAVYKSEIAKNGAPKGVMPGTTAIARGRFGQGQVFCFSPHPEKTNGLEPMVHRAAEFVRRKKAEQPARFPDVNLDQVSQTPDISQKGMPNSEYCAPCAVANVLYQFDRSGKTKLPPEFDIPQQSVEADVAGRALAEQLGSDANMNTVNRQGTSRYRLVNGLGRFLTTHSLPVPQVRYLGVRLYDRNLVDEAFRPHIATVVGVPCLHHLKRRLAEGDGVVILFGSYKPNSEKGGRLERVGGHYVAVAGYGQNAQKQTDSTSIILHDSNDSFQGNKYVYARHTAESTQLWSEGTLLAESRNLVRLENAPIQKDGRIAYLETIFSFDAVSD